MTPVAPRVAGICSWPVSNDPQSRRFHIVFWPDMPGAPGQAALPELGAAAKCLRAVSGPELLRWKADFPWLQIWAFSAKEAYRQLHSLNPEEIAEAILLRLEQWSPLAPVRVVAYLVDELQAIANLLARAQKGARAQRAGEVPHIAERNFDQILDLLPSLLGPGPPLPAISKALDLLEGRTLLLTEAELDPDAAEELPGYQEDIESIGKVAEDLGHASLEGLRLHVAIKRGLYMEPCTAEERHALMADGHWATAWREGAVFIDSPQGPEGLMGEGKRLVILAAEAGRVQHSFSESTDAQRQRDWGWIVDTEQPKLELGAYRTRLLFEQLLATRRLRGEVDTKDLGVAAELDSLAQRDRDRLLDRMATTAVFVDSVELENKHDADSINKRMEALIDLAHLVTELGAHREWWSAAQVARGFLQAAESPESRSRE